MPQWPSIVDLSCTTGDIKKVVKMENIYNRHKTVASSWNNFSRMFYSEHDDIKRILHEELASSQHPPPPAHPTNVKTLHRKALGSWTPKD